MSSPMGVPHEEPTRMSQAHPLQGWSVPSLLHVRGFTPICSVTLHLSQQLGAHLYPSHNTFGSGSFIRLPTVAGSDLWASAILLSSRARRPPEPLARDVVLATQRHYSGTVRVRCTNESCPRSRG